MKELYIRRVKIMIELVKTRMRDDHHPALSQYRLVPVHIEVVTKRHHLNKQRVKGRVDVIRRYVGDTGDQNVALPFYRDLVLLIIFFEDLFVNGLSFAGVTRYQFVLGRDGVEHLTPGPARQ